MIQEAYVRFETAKLLKEKGFDEATHLFYQLNSFNEPKEFSGILHNWNRTFNKYSKPTQALTMRWLREEKNCPIEILRHWDSDNQCEEWYFKHHVELREQPQVEYYDKYEKACEAAIKYCLEHLI